VLCKFWRSLLERDSKREATFFRLGAMVVVVLVVCN
jgi:hypothetical protein